MLLSASLILAILPFVTFAADNFTPCTTDCVYQATPEQVANVELHLYKHSLQEYTSIKLVNGIDLYDNLDQNCTTVIYIHGWVEVLDPGTADAVIGAYLERGGYNVIFLDWIKLSVNEWIFDARSLEAIAYWLAKALNGFVAKGFNTKGFNIIGHSMGAQIAGFTGRFANFSVERITGLDPAGPKFYHTIPHLASGDAEFVMIIHTDRGEIGIDLETGDADFYPNDGKNIQPGCLTLSYCSHYRSAYYYAESVRVEKSFIARSCESIIQFKDGACDSNEEVVMGFGTPPTARGSYYLQTGSREPYGLGRSGATYQLTNSISSVTSVFAQG